MKHVIERNSVPGPYAFPFSLTFHKDRNTSLKFEQISVSNIYKVHLLDFILIS